jgi:hypothetical protein
MSHRIIHIAVSLGVRDGWLPLQLDSFAQAGWLSRARHLLNPAFSPSWMVVFLLISHLAAGG